MIVMGSGLGLQVGQTACASRRDREASVKKNKLIKLGGVCSVTPDAKRGNHEVHTVRNQVEKGLSCEGVSQLSETEDACEASTAN